MPVLRVGGNVRISCKRRDGEEVHAAGPGSGLATWPLNGHTVTFDFTHRSFDGAKGWDSGEITFIAWDGSHWAARIDPVTFDTADNMPLHFTLRRA